MGSYVADDIALVLQATLQNVLRVVLQMEMQVLSRAELQVVLQITNEHTLRFVLPPPSLGTLNPGSPMC